MVNRLLFGFTLIIASLLASKYAFKTFNSNAFTAKPIVVQDTVKQDSLKDTIAIDSLSIESGLYNYKLYKSRGTASYYANRFNGHRTASGERYYSTKLTAAHRRLPFGTKVRVTNLRNGRAIIVKINDRGPHHRGREIDLSRKAFKYLANGQGGGEMRVKLELAVKKAN